LLLGSSLYVKLWGTVASVTALIQTIKHGEKLVWLGLPGIE
jgi:hypothetical protein